MRPMLWGLEEISMFAYSISSHHSHTTDMAPHHQPFPCAGECKPIAVVPPITGHCQSQSSLPQIFPHPHAPDEETTWQQHNNRVLGPSQPHPYPSPHSSSCRQQDNNDIIMPQRHLCLSPSPLVSPPHSTSFSHNGMTASLSLPLTLGGPSSSTWHHPHDNRTMVSLTLTSCAWWCDNKMMTTMPWWCPCYCHHPHLSTCPCPCPCAPNNTTTWWWQGYWWTLVHWCHFSLHSHTFHTTC